MTQSQVLQPGDRIKLSGGYDMEPAWLSNKEAVYGTLDLFIPGQNETEAAVIKLDAPITAGQVTGDNIVLELRWVGAAWNEKGVVHLELCDFEPEAKTWKSRRQGKWIESHATYERV